MASNKHTIEVSYPHNLENLFQKVIKLAGLPELDNDDKFALELSFVEAVNNALIHGNGKSKEKKVRLDFSFEDSVFKLTITDQGQGFDATRLPDPTTSDNIDKDSGRGVLLIRHYMDYVCYNEKGNSLTISKRINQP